MVIIHKQNIVDMFLMETLAEFHKVREKLRFFQEKYHRDFETFSIEVEGGRKKTLNISMTIWSGKPISNYLAILNKRLKI